MILTRNLIAEELLTIFKVIKVHQEPHAESTWTLQFEDYPPITYFDKGFVTIEDDENLVGKKIKAQIDLDASDEGITLITNPKEKKKSITYIPTGSIVVTGIYMDDIEEVECSYYAGRIISCLDSVYKLQVRDHLSNRFGFKKGDWIRVKTSERNILLSRKHIPLPE